ncbi:hypothetical protein E2C01_036220 [Portunus trituberculatus]|uniref:Uncharacterized protein n=1 Tax=Portunus trituberculatus TaxID=210409 RepID=A0A5B7FAM6_PORTR|nr:hypothetical protein [Portunus trituberculatus]
MNPNKDIHTEIRQFSRHQGIFLSLLDENLRKLCTYSLVATVPVCCKSSAVKVLKCYTATNALRKIPRPNAFKNSAQHVGLYLIKFVVTDTLNFLQRSYILSVHKVIIISDVSNLQAS